MSSLARRRAAEARLRPAGRASPLAEEARQIDAALHELADRGALHEAADERHEEPGDVAAPARGVDRSRDAAAHGGVAPLARLREREHELLACRAKTACGAVEPLEHDPLNRSVE